MSITFTLPEQLLIPIDHLELSTYEYDALDERYRKLVDEHGKLLNQHRKLKQLATAYKDIIQGSTTHEEPDVGLEQLQAEAGHEGLRAKALETDILTPFIRDTGGLEAACFLMQSAQVLIDQAGSLENLSQIVEGTNILSRRVHGLGGWQGLDQLVIDSKLLLAEQQALAKLERSVDGPNGLKSKASKYDRLKQVFTAVEAGRDKGAHQTSVPTENSTWKKRKRGKAKKNSAADPDPIKALPLTAIQKQYPTLPKLTGSIILSSELGVINSARAQMLISEPDHGDPDRDLYEPREPPVRKTPTKVDDANNMPLGRSRTDKLPLDYRPDASKKRRHESDVQIVNAKRPRVDTGRASALVHATLAASGTDPTNVFRPYTKPGQSRSPVSYSYERNEVIRSKEDNESGHAQHVGFIRDQVSELIESRGESKEADTTTSVRSDRSSVDSLLGSNGRVERRIIKRETLSGDHLTAFSRPVWAIRPSKDTKTQVLIGGYQIALWVGASNVGSYDPMDLIKGDQIPHSLAFFLFTETQKYLDNANAMVWAAMTPNSGTCILRYLVDGHRPSGPPQESRACRTCSSASVRHHRPCALLKEVHGVRTVVFMPLRDALRRGVAWIEKRFWIMNI